MTEVAIPTQCGRGAPAALPLDSGSLSGYGACFSRKDEVGSPCGGRWGYRAWRCFAVCQCVDSRLRGNDEFRRTGGVAWYSESARWILLRPSPTPAGDKPLASRSLRPR